MNKKFNLLDSVVTGIICGLASFIVLTFFCEGHEFDPEAQTLHVESRTSEDTIPYTGWGNLDTIPISDDVQDAVPLLGRVNFKWFRFKGPAGVVGCIFTADKKDGKLININSGRHCGGQIDSSCGFIVQGWQAWAIAGRSCDSFGIPYCNTLLCY